VSCSGEPIAARTAIATGGVLQIADNAELGAECQTLIRRRLRRLQPVIAGVRRVESLVVTLFEVPIDYGKMNVSN